MDKLEEEKWRPDEEELLETGWIRQYVHPVDPKFPESDTYFQKVGSEARIEVWSAPYQGAWQCQFWAMLYRRLGRIWCESQAHALQVAELLRIFADALMALA